MDSSSLLIDDFGPLPIRRPTSVAELCGLVKEAAGSGQGVYPVAGRTTLDVGLPPIKPGIALDTTALNQVIDYPARDMTITVQAGITMAKLQETLAAEGQWLPVDVPNPEQSTIGGAVALNKSGPRRYGYGTLRDYVIGISFATDEGNEVKAGGRVVKNVAGYDLMKLQVGAVGTLGVVTQLTLKVKPRPETSALVVFGSKSGAYVPDLLDLLHASKSRPVAVQIVSPSVTRRVPLGVGGYGYVIGFEEKAETVEWQIKKLRAELAAEQGNAIYKIVEFRGPESGPVWRALSELQTRPESQLIYKVRTRPSRVAGYFARSAAGGPDLLFAEALSGIVWGASDGDATEATSMERSSMERLQDLIYNPAAPQSEPDEARVAIRRGPTAWKKSQPVWGQPGSDRELMRHVKRTLDPMNVFNPGRLFGDL